MHWLRYLQSHGKRTFENILNNIPKYILSQMDISMLSSYIMENLIAKHATIKLILVFRGFDLHF